MNLRSARGRVAGLSLIVAALATAAPAQIAATRIAADPTAAVPASAVRLVRTGRATPDLSQPPLVPIHTAAARHGVPYGIWAAAGDYKVSFHDGMTFVPYLGGTYPHNQPWSWRTASVTVGEVELVWQEPLLTCSQLRAEYDLGGVVEAYDVRREGVEQTFVIARRPGVLGDLVVRGDVGTMLHATATAPRHGAVDFYDDGGAHVLRYGAATAVDAIGNTRAMTTSFENGHVTLRLDAAWLEAATFPVVVDPLLGVGDLVSGSTRTDVDVAHDPISSYQAVWISYVARASLLDTDVFCHRYNDDGTAAFAAFADVSSTWNTLDPSVAFEPSSNRALLVFGRGDSQTQTREIALHDTLRTPQGLQTNVTTVPTGGFPRHPCIGGTNNTNGGTKALLVWQQDGSYGGTSSSDIQGMLYDASNGTFGATIAISSGLLDDNERPSVNRYQRFTPATWRVAYQALTMPLFGIVNDDWDVGVVKVADDGSASATTWLETANTDHKFAPQIDGTLDNYLVTYVTEPQVAGTFPTGTRGDTVRGTRVVWGSSATGGTQPHGSRQMLTASLPGNAAIGGIAIDRDTTQHWAVTVGDIATSGFFVNRYGYTGAPLGQDTILTSGNPVLGGITFSHVIGEFPIAYAVNSGPFGGYVTMNRLAHPATTPPVVAGSSCSAASIDWTATTLIGDGRTKVRVQGAPGSAIQTLALSTGTANVPIVGLSLFAPGCTLLIDDGPANFIGLFPVVVGAYASWEVPLSELLPNGATFHFQGFHTDGSANLVFESTARLEVTVVK
jgi:hypothetical protein